MYEKENLAKGYDTPTESTARRPELIVLIERFQSAVNRFDGLTCEVRAKLQNIKQYSEPESKEVQMKSNQKVLSKKCTVWLARLKNTIQGLNLI